MIRATSIITTIVLSTFLFTGCGEDKRIEKDSTGKIISDAVYKNDVIYTGFKIKEKAFLFRNMLDTVDVIEQYKDGKLVSVDTKNILDFYKKKIDEDASNTQYIPLNQDEALIYAIEKAPENIKFIKNPYPPSVLEFYISKTKSYEEIRLLKEPSDKLMIEAIRHASRNFHLFRDKNSSQAVLSAYVTYHEDWSILPKITEKLPDEVQLKAVQASKENFKYLKEPSKEVLSFMKL
ncbi:hypothetical protein N5T57_10185 [Aliarcobacter cryaerophilus]|uniref:hypothetical protein n=1 Tax=Aliarcobacter cryaerophilus TaxID=28198 RepID=UPI0021B17905|nr:hypothetical protein [Aliarcobacter cryaerophilus]MCT7523293.1 hypothetical protein [Aliarcobacter cryaerophilus]